MLAPMTCTTQRPKVAHVIATAEVKRDYVVHFDGRSSASLAAVAITQQHARP
jgi:hypothetical protein